MKILLTTLNSKYSHSSLALRYLIKYCASEDYVLLHEEYTINESLHHITADIYKKEPNVVVFSCYIWNISETLIIIDRLKKVRKDIVIVIGGPEVSYDSVEILKKNSSVDYIIRGEGEESLRELVKFFKSQEHEKKSFDPSTIKGITYRDISGNVVQNQDRPLICSLDSIPFPYNEEDFERLSKRIVYYETSRGCPFNCSYCLSSTTHGIRYFSVARVKKDLEVFIRNRVKLVKFIDRTFNADKKRTMEIFKYIIEEKGNTRFHFEIAADLMDDELIECLRYAPKGLFQFEIGVQSTNLEVLDSVNRKSNLEKLYNNVKALRVADNIHLHLDLIAGLPKEGMSSFAKSFDDVFALEPHMLQLGFLKLLKGSTIRNEAGLYGYEFISEPPYEVLKNDLLKYDDIIMLHSIEDVLEKYHNSGVFEKALKFIFNNVYSSAFKFFKDLANHFAARGLERVNHSQKFLYDILFEFINECKNTEFKLASHQELTTYSESIKPFAQNLKFDFIKHQPGSALPYWAKLQEEWYSEKTFRESCFEFLKDDTKLIKFLPEYVGIPAKKLIKKIDFDVINFGDSIDTLQVFMFDRSSGNVYDVTEVWDKLTTRQTDQLTN